jgi:WD40 repeat protein
VPGAAQINAAEFSSSGDRLVVATQDASSPLSLMSFPAGPLRPLTGQKGPVKAVRFIPPDGKTFLTASIEGTVMGWDAASGQRIFTLDPQSEQGDSQLRQLLSLAVSPDASLAAAGDASGSIHLWDILSRHPIGRLLHGRNAQVRGLDFSPDGRMLASAGQDGAVKLWNVNGNSITERTSIMCGKPLAPETTAREGCTALVFIDDHTLEVADRDGDIRQYETDLPKLLAQARSLVDLRQLRPDAVDACKKYLRKPVCQLP